jgi:hypothetical protein
MGDLDGNSVRQVWGYVMLDILGTTVAGSFGCTGVWNAASGAAELTNVFGPCGSTFGRSEF